MSGTVLWVKYTFLVSQWSCGHCRNQLIQFCSNSRVNLSPVTPHVTLCVYACYIQALARTGHSPAVHDSLLERMSHVSPVIRRDAVRRLRQLGLWVVCMTLYQGRHLEGAGGVCGPQPYLYRYTFVHRPLKIRTDGVHAGVHELGSIDFLTPQLLFCFFADTYTILTNSPICWVSIER